MNSNVLHTVEYVVLNAPKVKDSYKRMSFLSLDYETTQTHTHTHILLNNRFYSVFTDLAVSRVSCSAAVSFVLVWFCEVIVVQTLVL